MANRIDHHVESREHPLEYQPKRHPATHGRPLREMCVAVEISPGELIDKITILEIKRARLHDPAKLFNVVCELRSLMNALEQHVEPRPELTRLMGQLREINETLWSAEDEIRALDRSGGQGREVAECARRIFAQNDRRAATKRRINELLGSRFIEEKAYAD